MILLPSILSPYNSPGARTPPTVRLRSCVLFLLAACAGLTLLSGCGGSPVQSMLHPASAPSARIAGLWWLLFGVCAAVFLIVMLLLLVAVFRRPGQEGSPRSCRSCSEEGVRPRREQDSAPLGSQGFVVVGGVLVPSVILVGFLVASLDTTAALRMPAASLTIQVIGHQWWWEFHYPDGNITTANEITIPVGEPVRLELTSADVIHSFWVPRLNGKIDLMPGQTTTFWIAADRPGNYRGQCAEYCGVQHALMAFFVVALPREGFEAWVAQRRVASTVAGPENAATGRRGESGVPALPRRRVAASFGASPRSPSPRLQRGQQAFFRAGCDRCHTIRGTRANGKEGPDLTHLGSRLTLGAGTIPNTYGNLQGWIANPQAIKPGNKMPRMYVAPNDLHALAAFLESLQ